MYLLNTMETMRLLICARIIILTFRLLDILDTPIHTETLTE